MIGLGRMGANMARRVMSKGHQCVVQDPNADAVARMVAAGAVGAATLQEMASKMTRPRAVWMMVPAAVVDQVLDDLVAHLDPGDIIIDGGNSLLPRRHRPRRSASRTPASTTSTAAPAAASPARIAATA